MTVAQILQTFGTLNGQELTLTFAHGDTVDQLHIQNVQSLTSIAHFIDIY